MCFCVGAIFRIEYFGGFDRLGREKMLAVFLLAGCLRVWLSYDEVCYWYRGNMGFCFSLIFFARDYVFLSRNARNSRRFAFGIYFFCPQIAQINTKIFFLSHTNCTNITNLFLVLLVSLEILMQNSRYAKKTPLNVKFRGDVYLDFK